LKYCLVVEIDGGQHNLELHLARDKERDEKLATGGFLVLRFWNSDVDANLAGVLEVIHAALVERNPHPAAFCGHPPAAGEG
jgi:very-short-patch-repair endonuclease